MNRASISRRHFGKRLGCAAVGGLLTNANSEEESPPFALNYVLSSALYGNFKLETILPEIAKSGAIGLDLWGKPHGTQREELDAMGVNAFAELLAKHETKLTVSDALSARLFWVAAGDAHFEATGRPHPGMWHYWPKGTHGKRGAQRH